MFQETAHLESQLSAGFALSLHLSSAGFLRFSAGLALFGAGLCPF